jgi:hypothetical protein
VLAAGRPVAGAQVALSAAGDSGFRPRVGFAGGGEQAALSDDGGRFRFDRLNPGRYTLGASLRDESSTPVEAVLTGDESQEVQLVLSEGAVVRGIVTGLPEAQLAGVDVSAQGRDYFSTTRTAAGGGFELAGVPEGTLTSAPGSATSERLTYRLDNGHDRPRPGRGGGGDRFRAGLPRRRSRLARRPRGDGRHGLRQARGR